MTTQTYLTVAAFLLVFSLFSSAAWRLRSHASGIWANLFFLACVLLLLFVPSLVVAQAVIDYLSGGNAAQALAAGSALYRIALCVAPLLSIAWAIAFYFSIRRLCQRPNNSFKPKPLRGSA